MLRLLFWPFYLAWWTVGFVFQILGSILTAVTGLILMAAGIVLTITIVGAVAGIPILLAGALLLVRSLF